MASNNFFNVVNISGGALTTTVDGKTIKVPVEGDQSTGHTFKKGEEITTTINGNLVKLSLHEGVNSWSTLVFTTQGINVFPSAANQEILPY
ncbi:hypothetical protein IMCC3317_46090 [Kordia antarctica]|uniref:Uncharacterized protein n=1 Tax=Kordia antarctica TaxID=1218801 RepID=A0A7L4ZVH0_9FLAO|nr:hypothetical protein [Kordia antarctica]QHI39204.1 hypothetical protein IMCC3317_46090 [Kordia antarctica]